MHSLLKDTYIPLEGLSEKQIELAKALYLKAGFVDDEDVRNPDHKIIATHSDGMVGYCAVPDILDSEIDLRYLAFHSGLNPEWATAIFYYESLNEFIWVENTEEEAEGKGEYFHSEKTFPISVKHMWYEEIPLATKAPKAIADEVSRLLAVIENLRGDKAGLEKELSRLKQPVTTAAANPKPMLETSLQFLSAVMDIQQERGAEYNKDQSKPERSFNNIATAYNAITGQNIKGSEVALLLQILKDVRQWTNPESVHTDSLVDGVSYASLKAELIVSESING